MEPAFLWKTLLDTGQDRFQVSRPLWKKELGQPTYIFRPWRSAQAPCPRPSRYPVGLRMWSWGSEPRSMRTYKERRSWALWAAVRPSGWRVLPWPSGPVRALVSNRAWSRWRPAPTSGELAFASGWAWGWGPNGHLLLHPGYRCYCCPSLFMYIRHDMCSTWAVLL